MAKTSKTVPQGKKASSSSRPASGRTVVPPRIEECIPGPCELSSDFKIDKPASVPGRCEPMSRYICLITEYELEQVKKDCDSWPDLPFLLAYRQIAQLPFDDAVAPWFPGVIPDLAGLRDDVAMRPPPPSEEEVPKPTKEKKRKRASPASYPKPMKSKARKPRANPAALSAEAVQHLRNDEEEGEDEDCLLVARKRGSTEASKSAEPVMADMVHSRTEEISEGGSSRVPEPSGGKSTSHPGGHLAGELEEPSSEALQRKDSIPSESRGIINIDDSPMGPVFSEGKFREAQAMRVEDDPGPNALFIFDEAQRLLKQAVALHRQAFSKSQAELARCESELKKLVEERDIFKRLYVQKEEEVRDLRVELTKARQQQTEVIEKLREELKGKKAETLGWKQHMDRLASEKDTLWDQLTSIERQLQNAKREILAQNRKIEELEAKSVAELAKAKSEAEAFVASYRADAEATNIRAQEISIAAEVKTLEDEAAALLSDDEDSTSGSESGGYEDEVPEEEIPKDVALKDPEDAVPEDVAPKVD
ncbi:PREDICTED: titin-like [Nicotiana attenuata]|uniref:titin-like n=1 Tax=Nicotiana attenuata TaxID=49451 RepID=UPI000904EF1A|nr:PREDICTED: titin-like [Nicotiana attenuata]